MTQKKLHHRAPTINDVAKQAGTSSATVSRYFNHPERVKPKTASRIEAAAKDLRYIRNRAAAATRSRISGTIGMVVPTVENSIFAELIENLTGELRSQGRTMLIASNLYDKFNEVEAVKTFAEHGVDGVILIGTEHDPQIASILSAQGVPYLCVWNHPQQEQPPSLQQGLDAIDTVGIDNVAIGYAAADHIIKLGHRRIGCIFGNASGNDRAAGRKQGIMQRLGEAAITPPLEWLCQSSYELHFARTIANDLLNRPDRPSAIICGNDVIAFAVIWSAQSLGLHVPDDLSVMGIGDFQGAADMYPPLSTIRIPARTIGKLAASRIIDMINNPEATKLRQLKVDFEVKLRDSTTAIPK